MEADQVERSLALLGADLSAPVGFDFDLGFPVQAYSGTRLPKTE